MPVVRDLSHAKHISRSGKKIRARGYPQIKSVMGTGRVAKRVPAGYNKRVFNYPLLYGHGHGFDDTRARGYPYPLIY